MALRLTNVQKAFIDQTGARLPILDVPEFSLESGEQVALVGESGGGKTTLLNVIAGITAVDAGQIHLDGTDVARLSEPARDRFRALKIGYIFQTFNLLPGFTAFENVLLGMSFSGVKADRERAKQLLERVGLAHRLHHRPTTMSVGEQQRVAVARALVKRPALLLADEPTASIDAKHQASVLQLIREICTESRCGLLLVTHSQDVAQQFPRVARLSDFNRVAAAAETA